MTKGHIIKRVTRYVGWDGFAVLVALAVTLTVVILVNSAIDRDLPGWIYFLILFITFFLLR